MPLNPKPLNPLNPKSPTLSSPPAGYRGIGDPLETLHATVDDIHSACPEKEPEPWELIILIMGNAGFISSAVGF